MYHYATSESCAFSFDVNDKLTEDAAEMLGSQEIKAACIRTLLFDFTKANGIINDYDKIPKKIRLEKFFGYHGYRANTAANVPLTEKKEAGRHKCRCHIEISVFNYYDPKPDEEFVKSALAMMYISGNAPLLIRELFLDFVTANGIVKNYTKIPEKERLERFFGYTAPISTPAKQPDRIVEIRLGKDFKFQTIRDESGQANLGITCTTSDGIVLRVLK